MSSSEHDKPKAASGDANPHAATEISGSGYRSIPDDDEDASFVGELLGDRYRVERVIGRGGMGTVYLAEHVQLKKRIALKMLSNQMRTQPELAARFLNEARAAAQIGHPNIVDVYDLGQLPGGGAFIAMALLEGVDLQSELTRSGAMPFERAKHIVGQICRALAAAHAKGITHRDMKPANVFLVRDPDGGEQVKIVDFGIAQVRDGDQERARLTQTGAIVGTPAFMSPEQARGYATDHRTDIYSVGCILYTMLTNQLVFDGPNVTAVITAHLFDAPIPPSQRKPEAGIAPEIDAVVLRALAKSPEERYQTMKELWLALEALNPEPAGWPEPDSGRFIPLAPRTTGPRTVSAGPPSISTDISTAAVPSLPKGGSLGVLGGAIAVGATLAVGGWWMLRKPAPPEPVVLSQSQVRLELRANQPGAQATVRGRVHALPIEMPIARTGNPEMIEVNAPGYQPYRTWVTLDRDRTLDIALAPVAPSASPRVVEAPPPATAPAPVATSSKRKRGTHSDVEPAPVPVAVPAPVPAAAPVPVAAPAPEVASASAPAPAPAPPVAATPRAPAAPAPAAPAPVAPAQPLVLAPGTMQRVLEAHRGAVDACIGEDPSASGRLVYKLTIAPSGAVSGSRLVEAARRFPSIEHCLARVFTSWSIVPAPGRAAEGQVRIELD